MIPKSLTFVKTYSGEDIDFLYKKITEDIVLDGKDITFGSAAEPKRAREIYATIQLYGKAIPEILAGKTPENFRWSGDKITDYQDSFLISLEEVGIKKFDDTDFEYTYIELMRKFKTMEGDIDQMVISKDKLAENLKTKIQSNQNVGVIYHPMYWNSHNPPCFNWYQVRMLDDNQVSLRLLFRSNDYGDAVWANLCGVAKAFDELVIKPAGCVLVEIILTSSSAHIYANEADLAKKVSGFDWDRDENEKKSAVLRLLGHKPKK
ncbi:thymidylate synthase [Methanolapillus millepedarum]|uniref:Thymidylate synthase n=1 Tax=Methanolapillus millepedarum TaxID=3028296 RepID=A0AA96VBJ4_9EURY|nr:Thymidylate synthase [Methanosarcinaceae archaeon Ac7]